MLLSYSLYTLLAFLCVEEISLSVRIFAARSRALNGIMCAPRWAGHAVGVVISVRICDWLRPPADSLVCRWNSGSLVATGC